jgi:hypothetical protein
VSAFLQLIIPLGQTSPIFCLIVGGGGTGEESELGAVSLAVISDVLPDASQGELITVFLANIFAECLEL